MSEAAAAATPLDTPQVLLVHHLKALKLPPFLREHEKLARQCAAEGADHLRYLLRLAELELIERERRMVERRIRTARFPTVKSLDGFDFLRKLRARPEWASIPVVVVTAKDVTPAERERLKGEAARVIQKGSSGMHDLLAAVRKAAGHPPPAAPSPAGTEKSLRAGEV